MLRREEPVQVLARPYDVADNTRYGWRDAFLEAGQAALAKGRAG